MKISKRFVAKEWLIFLSSVFFGVVFLWPFYFSLYYGFFLSPFSFVSNRWELAYKYGMEIEFVFFLFSPYLLIMFLRSVVWAIKQIFRK